MKKSDSTFNYKEFILTLLIVAISFFAWETKFIFPIKLFTILLHEISHAIACIFTGGKIIELNIDFNLGGKCITQDGNAFLISFAGYTGSFLFGALLTYSSYKNNTKFFSIIFIATIISLFAINSISNKFIGFISILIAISLLAIIKFIPEKVSNYVLRGIGLISCFYVLYDLKNELFSEKHYLSDLSIMAEITGIPSYLWGFFIMLINIIWLLIIFKIIHKK